MPRTLNTVSFMVVAIALSACATMEATQGNHNITQAELANMSCEELLQMQAAFEEDAGMVADIVSVFSDITGQSTTATTGLTSRQRRGLSRAANMVFDQVEKRGCEA